MSITRFKQPIRLDYQVPAGPTTDRFLTGILEKKLLGRRCPACRKVYMPPRGACPTCAELCEEEVEVAQQGVVTTFCVVNIPFEGQLLTPPYACAHILLDGCDSPLLHLVGGCDAADVKMGLRVRAVWKDEVLPTLASISWFEPVS